MNEQIRKLIKLVNEKDALLVYPKKVKVPGLKAYVEERDGDAATVSNTKKFKEYMLKNDTLDFDIVVTRTNPDHTTTSLEIYDNGNIDVILCDNAQKDNMELGDPECKSCKFYKGKDKCIAREYETKR